MPNYDELKQKWGELGRAYATAVNEMVNIGERDNWESYSVDELKSVLLKGGMKEELVEQICASDEPLDLRADIAEAVFGLLKKANESGEVDKFRADFAPSNVIITEQIDKQLADISHICFLGDESVMFIAKDARKSRAYLLKNAQVSKFSDEIIAISKAKQGEIYALANSKDEIVVVKNLNADNGGEVVAKFHYKAHEYNELKILPFNDGSRVLVIDYRGIFIVDSSGERLVYPSYDEDDEICIDMAHATLSNDNKFIVAGEQCSVALFDANGEHIADIEPPCSYPHFALFSKDDSQLISNACHFYEGDTIGIARELLNAELNLEYDDEMNSSTCVKIDTGMRVYAGVATEKGYILGDAYGYIRAMDHAGNKLWWHYLGGTILSMAISNDEKTLFVGTYGGRLHCLKFGEGQDAHTIGNGNYREEFRLLVLKSGEILKW